MTLATLTRQARKLFTPKPRLTVSEWADAFAYVPNDGNAEGGKYRCARMPYQKAMLDDAIDPTLIECYWLIASQLGKTLCFVIIDGYFIHQDPSPILDVYPTIDSAKAYRREKLDPFIKATPCLRGKVKSPRSRDSENTTLNFKFQGGNLTICGANSPSGLRQRSKRVIKCDEISTYEANSEGDPLPQADRAAKTFHNAVKLRSSTPTFVGECRVTKGYEKSDKQKWFCPCPKCGFEQVLEWEQMRFDEVRPQDARYECENAGCRYLWTDAERIGAIASGCWRATAPFVGIRGRYVNGLYRIIGKKDAFATYLHEFVAEYLDAKEKGEMHLIVWENIFRARAYERKSEVIEIQPLLDRREMYAAQVPTGALCLTAGGDVHPDRIELSTWGWGDGEESWLIEHRVFTGNTSEEFVWQNLSDYLRSEFTHESGHKMRIACTFIDAGHNTNDVYRFTKKMERFGVYACKGLSGPGSRFAPLAPALPARNNALRAARFDIGTHAAKNQLFYRIRVDKPGPRYIHFPSNDGRGADLTYFEQLTAERLIAKRVGGQLLKVWEIPEGEDFQGVRNETLDCAVYASAAVFRLRPNWAALKKRLEVKVEDKAMAEKTNAPDTKPSGRAESVPRISQPEKPTATPRPRQIRPRRESSFVKGWR